MNADPSLKNSTGISVSFSTPSAAIVSYWWDLFGSCCCYTAEVGTLIFFFFNFNSSYVELFSFFREVTRPFII